MKRFLFCCLAALSCLFFVCSCEKEEDVVSNIQSLHLAIMDGNMTIYPIFGEGDNCTYTIVYYLDETEIGRERKYPYKLVYELTPENLTAGEHVIKVDFYGKHSGKATDVYMEKTLSIKYSVTDDDITLEGASTIM